MHGWTPARVPCYSTWHMAHEKVPHQRRNTPKACLRPTEHKGKKFNNPRQLACQTRTARCSGSEQKHSDLFMQAARKCTVGPLPRQQGHTR
eukprot:364425-Chlamydomonas_euryale.AAC.5